MKKTGRQNLGRRHFLQQLLLVGGATGVGAAMLATSGPSKAMSHAQATSGSRDDTGKGYHLTEHIRTYYDKARI